MIERTTRFMLTGMPVYCEPYGNGHINTTSLVKTDMGCEYILQKVNKHVFKEPKSLMRNVAAVTDYLKQSAEDPRSVLTLIPTLEGDPFYFDEDGETWRVYDFVANSLALERAETPDDFYESGVAFGRFQKALTGFDASILSETIPRFHDTPNRYKQLRDAMRSDPMDRLREVKVELDFVFAQEDYAQTLVCLQIEGTLPLRVTHNDTKLNNVLFDSNTRKALCVIDLDTVMPGLSANDFGDSIRFGASTAAEDEVDLSKVSLSMAMFEAYTRGYISSSDLTSAERIHLCDGAKMMTLECGIRFLTDYLAGDTYFRIGRPSHNLDRARTQFKLVTDMELKWSKMQQIVSA